MFYAIYILYGPDLFQNVTVLYTLCLLGALQATAQTTECVFAFSIEVCRFS